MVERKVLNKYYSPHFDPAKLSRALKPKNKQDKIIFRLPMSTRCKTCGNYMFKGTKFNSRKEKVVGETYLGIKLFRFYLKCYNCSVELIIKTDPRNSDYIVKAGAKRNFKPWRDDQVDNYVMKSLKKRSLENKKEIDIMVSLEDIISLNSTHSNVTVDAMLHDLHHRSAPNKWRMLLRMKKNE